VKTAHYQLELENRIERGRCVGQNYVVTQRPIGKTKILVRFPTRALAIAWIIDREESDNNAR
jgi:hypothetical protein